MRLSLLLLPIVFLWGQPSKAAEIWTLEIHAYLSGTSTVQCCGIDFPDEPPTMTVYPISQTVRFLIEVPAIREGESTEWMQLLSLAGPFITTNSERFGGTTLFLYYGAGQLTSSGLFTGGMFGRPRNEFIESVELTAAKPHVRFVSATGGPAPVLIAPVPEPATWALLVMGFGLLASILRRRPAKPKSCAVAGQGTTASIMSRC